MNGQVAVNQEEFIILEKGKHSKYETYAKRADLKSTASSFKFLIWFAILIIGKYVENLNKQ